MFPTGAVREAYGVGLREFGENYVREFEGKAPEVQDAGGRALSPHRPFAVQ